MASGLRRAGIHVVSSEGGIYPEAMAMVANGDAWLLGERYDENGARHLAVAVGVAKPNPRAEGQIRIGGQYYSKVLYDYDNWEEKWWREAIQNAVDAGATEIRCSVTRLDDGNMLVSCDDNGRGMDYDTILDKFLVLGESTKDRPGSGELETAGGFGKAKELLVLPWIRWQIDSQSSVFSGQNVQWSSDDRPYRDGTALSVIMPGDKYTGASFAAAYIGKCTLPGIRFIVTDELGETREIRAELRRGKEIRSFGEKAILYQNKSATFPASMLVRVKGLNMFVIEIAREVQGTLILELVRPSTELLTSNRDGWRDKQLRYEVGSFVNTLAADVKSALQTKRGLVKRRFAGAGLFTMSDQDKIRSRMSQALYDATLRGGRGFKLDETQLGDVQFAVGQSSPVTAESELSFAPDGALVRAMLSDLKIMGPDHVYAISKQAAWKPDFCIINDEEGFHVSAKFEPENMTPGLVKLAKFWAELCRFVLIQLGNESSYGVGWHFGGETLASFATFDGERWLLLNPFRGAHLGGEVYSLGNKEDVARLYASAIHEVTHMANRVDSHNEAFAIAITENIAKCANKWRQVEAIRKAVVSRKKPRQEETPDAVEQEQREFPYYFGSIGRNEIVPITIILAAVDVAPKRKTAEQITSYIQSHWGASFGVGSETAQGFVEDGLRSLVLRALVTVDDMGRYETTDHGMDALIWLDNRPIETPPEMTGAAHSAMASLAMIVGPERLSDFLERYPGQDEMIRKALGLLNGQGLIKLDWTAGIGSGVASHEDPANWWVQAHLTRESAIRVARWYL